MTSPSHSSPVLLAGDTQETASSPTSHSRSASRSPSPVPKEVVSPSALNEDQKEDDERAEDSTRKGDAKPRSPIQSSLSQTEPSVEDESHAPTSRSQAAADDKATQAEGHPWQAVWSPPHNAYYFWNSQTNTTTWVNPLEAEGSSSALGTAPNSVASTSAIPQPQQQEALGEEDLARQAGIDPELAHLDPALYASQLRMAASSAASSGFTALAADRDLQARFSQTSKAKRQMSAYFDVEAWEQQREAEHAAQAQALAEDSGGGYAGIKRGKGNRHPSKKEVQEFKERKRERKKAKLGWLHS